MSNNRLLILIPAYNAAHTLDRLVRDIRTQNLPYPYDILVVNDGSTDETSGVVRRAGVRFLEHEKNRGKGAALRTGFQFALQEGYSILITMDADLQHPPGCLNSFLEKWEKEQPDMIVGCRSFAKGNMPLIRRVSNFLTSRLLSLKTGVYMADVQSGYRLIRTGAICRLVLRTSHYETESEILIKMARVAATISSITVPTIYGTGKSHISHFIDTLRFIRMFLTT